MPSKRQEGVIQRGAKQVDLAKLRTVILGEGQTLANVYVAVKSGLDIATFPPPNSPVVLRHFEFVYEPRVVGLMSNQELKVRNDDEWMHNFHVTPKHNLEFNQGHSKGAEGVFRFLNPEIAIPVKCDIHPWEYAWIHVADHPYFSVTGVDGRFAIPGLPPGDYEILAWHERFRHKPLVSKVTVREGQVTPLDFTFEAPKQ